MPQYRVILMPKYATNLSFVNAKVKQSALCYTCCKTIIIIHTCIQSYWWYPYILPAWIHADSQTSTDIVPLTIASFFSDLWTKKSFITPINNYHLHTRVYTSRKLKTRYILSLWNLFYEMNLKCMQWMKYLYVINYLYMKHESFTLRQPLTIIEIDYNVT